MLNYLKWITVRSHLGCETHMQVSNILRKMRTFLADNDISYWLSDLAPNKWDDLKQYHPNNLIIWDGASEETIWGTEGNYIFRAVHDHIHIKYGLDFTLESEIKVREITCELLKLTKEEALILEAEIDGQAIYYYKHGEFPKNQIKFIANYLNQGV